MRKYEEEGNKIAITIPQYTPTKSDWKLFLEKLHVWQEAFMDKLNHEYIALLSGEGKPSDKFWNLYERQKNDKRLAGVLLWLRKSEMPFGILRLIREGAITIDDLDEFSDELKNYVKYKIENPV